MSSTTGDVEYYEGFWETYSIRAEAGTWSGPTVVGGAPGVGDPSVVPIPQTALLLLSVLAFVARLRRKSNPATQAATC